MNYPKTFDEYVAQKRQNGQAAGNSSAASGGFSFPATFDEYMAQKQTRQNAPQNTQERERCLSASGWTKMQSDMQELFGTMDGYFAKKHRIGASGSGYTERVGAMLQSVEKEKDYFNRYADVMGQYAQSYNDTLNRWAQQLKRYQSALSGKEEDESALALGSGLARFQTEASEYMTAAAKAPEAGTAIANRANQWVSGAQKLLGEAQEIEDYLKKKNTPAAKTLLQQMESYKEQLAQMQKSGEAAQVKNPLTGKPMGSAINPNLPRYAEGETATAGSPFRLGQQQEKKQNTELSEGLQKKAQRADWQNQTVQQHEAYIRQAFNELETYTRNGTSQGAAENIHAGIFEEIAARLNYLAVSGKCTDAEYEALLDETERLKKKYLEDAERAYRNYPNKWSGDAQGAIRTAAEAIPDKGTAMKEFRYQEGNLTRENIAYQPVDKLLERMHFTYSADQNWGNSAAERAAITFMGEEVLPEYLANVEMTQEQYDRYLKQISGTQNEAALRQMREANGLNANEQGKQEALEKYREIDGQTYLTMFETGSRGAADNVMEKYPGGMEQVFRRGLGYIAKATGKVLNVFGENPVGSYFEEGGQQGIDYVNEDWQQGKQKEYEQGRYSSDLLQNGNKFEKWTASMTKDLTQAALEMAAAGAVAGQISAGNAALTQLSQGGKYASTLAEAQKGATGYMKFAGQMANLMRNSSNVIISANAALNSYGEAEDKGLSAPERAIKLIAGGLIEYGTNGLFGGNPVVDPDGAGALAKYIYKLTDNETIRKIVSSKVFDRIGEGMEEVASAVAGAALDYALTGETGLSAEELVNEFTVGVLLSMVMSAPEDIIDLTARAKNYIKAHTITRFGVNAQTNLDVLYNTMAQYEMEYLAGDENLMRMNGKSEKEIKRAKSEWETIVREFNTLADRLEGQQSISDSFERYSAPEGYFDNDFVDAEYLNVIKANEQSEAALLTDRALDIRIMAERAEIESLRGSSEAQDIYSAQDAQNRLDILEQEKATRRAKKDSEAAERAESETTTQPEHQTPQETKQTAQEAAFAQETQEMTPENNAPEADVSMNEGGNNSEQQQSVSESEERNVRMDSAGQAGRVDESAAVGRADTGAAENGRGTEREALRRQKLNERVERFQGLTQDKSMDKLTADGNPDVLVGVVPVRSYTKEMQKIQRAAKERGLKTTFVIGTMSVKSEDGEYRNVDAIYDKEAGRIIASVSSAMFEPEQLVTHEMFHDRIAKQEIDLVAATEAAFRDVTPEEAAEISDQYTEAYAGVYDDFMAIYEEILADAAAGMNRFASAKFEPVIQAVQQLVTEAESNAPDAQISEAVRRTPPEDEKTAPKGGTKASMAGKKAKTASSKNLALAEAMEEDGASREEIWKKTGWLRGADGQWRFEIDDSKAVFRKEGDAKLMNENGYRRLQELTDKWADSFEGGKELSQAEEREMETLQEEYSDRVWEKKYELQDFLKHDELYDAYPMARHMTLRFEKLGGGVKGKFDKQNGTIVLSNSLFGKEQETILHEIQHVIQKIEGWQGGTSPEYWARKDYENGDHELDRLQEEYDKILNSLDRDEQNDYIRYQEIDGELEKLFYSDKPGDAEKYDRLDAEHDELYTKLYGNEWFTKLLDLKRQMDNPGEIYLRQYLNSAGEIEARETASRRSMTAEERRNKLPDLGWDRALMVDDPNRTKTQLSLEGPEEFAQEIDRWNEEGREKETFILGSTGEVLQGLGAIESDIYMLSEKIELIMKEHPQMTLEEIKRIPQVMNDPILVLKSKQKDAARGNTRLVLFGDIRDANGDPMLAVLDLIPVEGGMLIDDMQKIVSAYVKTGISSGFLKSSDAMYVDKKRAARLLRSAGLQLRPGSLPPNGSIGSITYRGKNVNINGVRFSALLEDTKGTKFSLSPAEKAQRAQGKADAAIAKAEDAKKAEQESYRKELTQGIKKLFDVQSYDNEALGKLLEAPMAEMQQGITLLQSEKDDLYEKLLDMGTAVVAPADEYFAEIRNELKGRRIFVPQGIRREIGDDWNAFKKKAFGNRIYFTSEESDKGADVHMLELAEMYPETFTEEYDATEMLRQIVDAAERGKEERMSLREGMKENAKRYGLTEQEQDEYQKTEFLKLLNKYAEQAGRDAREAQTALETDERLQSLIREADEAAGVKQKSKAVTEPWTISEAEAQKRGFPYLNGRQVYPLRTWVKAADMGNYGLVLDKSTKKGMLTVLFTNKETGLSTVKDMETKLLTAVDAKYQPSTTETAALLASMPQEKLEDAVDAQDLAEFYDWYDGQRMADEEIERSRNRAAAEQERKDSILRSAEAAEQRKQERLEDVRKAYLGSFGTPEPKLPYGKKKPMYSRFTTLQPGEALELLQAMSGKKWRLTNNADGTWKATITAEEAKKREISPAEAKDRLEAARKSYGDLSAGVTPDGVGKDDFKGSPALEKAGVKIDGGIVDYSQVDAMRKGAEAKRSVRWQIEKTQTRLEATKAEIRAAKEIALGKRTNYKLPDRCRPSVVAQLAGLYTNERMTGEDLIQIRKAEIRAALLYKMMTLFPSEREIQANPDLFKSEKLMVLNYRTALRNMLNIFGEERGQEIYDYLFAPVVRNTAESYRWTDRQFDLVREFKDSEGKKSKLNKTERAYVHMMLDVEGYVEQAKDSERSDILKDAAENVAKGESVENEAIEFSLNSEEAKIVEKYAQWIRGKDAQDVDKVKCENAMKVYRKRFDLYFEAINDFLVSHGMQPIGKIKGYTPHMPLAEKFNFAQQALDDLWKALGIKEDTVTTLPAEIAGRTETFRPQKRWNPFFLERKTDKTAYDIEEAFQNYVNYLGDIFFHTDDIQKVRAAESFLRKGLRGNFVDDLQKALDMSHSSDMEEKIEYLQQMGQIGTDDYDLSAAETAKVFDRLISELVGEEQNKTRYSNLVVWLKNYGDILAGKQFGGDRGTEYAGGREWLNIGNRLVSAFAKANVAGNLSSVLNQSAQLAMLQATRSQRAILKATQEFCTGKLGEFRKEIDFLTGKQGIDYLVQTGGEKIITGMFKPAEFVDSMLSTIATRAAYWDAIANGKSHEEAMQYADWYGRALMGDRTKGAKPVAFHAKGFFRRMANIFQIEPLNTVEFAAKDIPLEIQREAQRNGKKSAAKMLMRTIFGYLLAAFVLNRLTDELYGGTPAPLDIAGLTANFFASGKGLSTNDYIRGLINKVVGSDIFDVPEEREGFDTGAALKDTGYNLMNEIPFVSNVSAIFGVGDRSLPFPDIVGKGKTFGEALFPGKAKERSGQQILESGLDFLAELVPGGRQAKKTGYGIKALAQGGKTTGYGEKERLQYPLDMENPMTYIRTALFGVNASPEAKAYFAGDYSGLTADQTKLWNELREEGANGVALYGLMMRMDDAMDFSDIPEAKDESEAEKAKRLKLKEEHRKAARAELLAQEGLTDGQKMRIYSEMVSSYNDDDIEKLASAGMKWKDISELLDKRGELSAGRDSSEWAAEFANWVDGKHYSTKQKTVINEALGSDSAKFYNKMTAAGVSANTALKIEKKSRELAGENDMNQSYKAQAIIQTGASDKEAYAALAAVYTGEGDAEKFKAAQEEGIPAKEYAKFRMEAGKLESDKDENGKVITDSRKEKVIELIDSLNLTADQKEWIMEQTYKNVNWWKMPWY